MPAAWFDPNMTKSELEYTFEIQDGPRGKERRKRLSIQGSNVLRKGKNGKRTVDERNERLMNEITN